MFSQLSADDRPSIWDIDWVLNLRSILLACDDVRIYPGQILVSKDSNGERLSFVHGVPGASGLASTNFAHDKRKRRALMERAGVPIPKGATFSYGSGKALAKRFAERTGFPLTVKPALGDNGVDAQLGVYSLEALEVALDALAAPPQERPHHNKSSYRLMLLDEPERTSEGVRVPPKYRFLVEKHIEGQLYRFLISAGTVISALKCEGSPSDGSFSGAIDVANTVDPKLVDVALDAARAVPEMLVCAIDVVAPSRPESGRAAGVVVDYHERPGLWMQAAVDEELAFSCSDQLLKDYAADQRFELTPDPDPSGDVVFSFVVPGERHPQAPLDPLSVTAPRLNVDVTQTVPESPESPWSGVMRGPATSVALLLGSVLSSAQGRRIPEIALRRVGSPLLASPVVEPRATLESDE